MKKIKETAIKIIWWVAAFIYAMNLLGAISMVAAGKFTFEFWGSLYAGVGGGLILYFSRPARREAIAARHNEWKERSSSNLGQVLFLWFGAWFALTCAFATLSWGLSSQTNLHKYQVLVKQGKMVNGQITAKEPNNHQLVV